MIPLVPINGSGRLISISEAPIGQRFKSSSRYYFLILLTIYLKHIFPSSNGHWTFLCEVYKGKILPLLIKNKEKRPNRPKALD